MWRMGFRLSRREFFRRSSAAGALAEAGAVPLKGESHPPRWAGEVNKNATLGTTYQTKT